MNTKFPPFSTTSFIGVFLIKLETHLGISPRQRKLSKVLSSRTISFEHLLEFRPPLVLTPAQSPPLTPDELGLDVDL